MRREKGLKMGDRFHDVIRLKPSQKDKIYDAFTKNK